MIIEPLLSLPPAPFVTRLCYSFFDLYTHLPPACSSRLGLTTMPNRYYRISPTPLLSSSREKIRSLAYLAWLWSSRTISVLLPRARHRVSCAPVFTPTTLQNFKESRETSSTTAVERPRLALSPHSDGLGWTVRVTQTVEEKNRIRRRSLGGYTYERRLNLVTMVGGDYSVVQISCSIPLSMGTPNQPGWSSPWQYCLAAAGYDVPGRADTRTRIADDLDPQVQLLRGYLWTVTFGSLLPPMDGTALGLPSQ